MLRYRVLSEASNVLPRLARVEMSDEMALLIADVYEAAGALRRWGEAVAAAEGQTQSRWQVLSVVSESPMTVPAAARRLGISRQAVQRTVNELVADGLVRTAPNPDHRTAALVELTDVGRDRLARMTRRATEVHRELGGAFLVRDIEHARDVLQRLVIQVRGAAAGPG